MADGYVHSILYTDCRKRQWHKTGAAIAREHSLLANRARLSVSALCDRFKTLHVGDPEFDSSWADCPQWKCLQTIAGQTVR